MTLRATTTMMAAALGLAVGLVSAGCDDGGTPGTGCGDGQPILPEMCDDGNNVDGDGCSAQCQVEHGYVCWDTPSICRSSCGDGMLAANEGCDDGNHLLMDGCDANCAIEAGFSCAGEPSVCSPDCGDGMVLGTEACDDGNNADGDGCSASCAVETGYACEGTPSVCHGICGNGATTPDEECDDGNNVGGDGCGPDCAVEQGYACAGLPSVCTPVCGDGLVVGGEACDDGGESATCDDDCTPAACGDGDVNVTAAEECDDGNNVDCDGCSATCVIEPLTLCGDGMLECGEQCDDGNGASGDGCSPLCVIEPGWSCTGTPAVCTPICGDGMVVGSEQCDDGNTADCDGCSASCAIEAAPSCGDGFQVCGEQCDDGNTVSGDGCSAICVIEYCGDGIVQAGLGEVCDDGGASATCDDDCTPAACGDGAVNPAAGEQCDDGNTVSGDGCDALCQWECDITHNLALDPGVVATSSGGGDTSAGYGPEKMIDGFEHADCATHNAHWVLADSTPNGDWIELQWPAPVTIGRISFDTVNAFVADCIGSNTGRSLSGGTVQWWDGAGWVTLATVAGFVDDWEYSFPTPVTTTRVRLMDIWACGATLCPGASQYSNPIIIEFRAFCM